MFTGDASRWSTLGALPRPPQILERALNPFFVVSELPKRTIAHAAQHAADPARLVTVINVRRRLAKVRRPTDRTGASLALEQQSNLFFGDPVQTLQGAVAVCRPGPVLVLRVPAIRSLSSLYAFWVVIREGRESFADVLTALLYLEGAVPSGNRVLTCSTPEVARIESGERKNELAVSALASLD
jgi:hypothetical protein